MRPKYTVPAIVFLASLCGVVYAQSKQIKVDPIGYTTAQKGVDLYREFCAVCHGADGKGHGPAEAALVSAPSDLTQINRRNGNKFPATKIMRIINGDDTIAAHGSVDMPTWGTAFKSVSANATFAEMRVRALTAYLQEIQR